MSDEGLEHLQHKGTYRMGRRTHIVSRGKQGEGLGRRERFGRRRGLGGGKVGEGEGGEEGGVGEEEGRRKGERSWGREGTERRTRLGGIEEGGEDC